MFSSVVFVIMATLRAFALRKPVTAWRAAAHPDPATAPKPPCAILRENQRDVQYLLCHIFYFAWYKGWQVYVIGFTGFPLLYPLNRVAPTRQPLPSLPATLS